jgi:hypothetical protein
MNSTRSLVIAVGLIVLSGQVTSAQDMSRYRVYVLESSLDSVVAASGARAADAKTLHVRPATIQDLEWRAPYAGSGTTLALISDSMKSRRISVQTEYLRITAAQRVHSGTARRALRPPDCVDGDVQQRKVRAASEA